MLSEALPHARLEDREIPFGMQPPTVDDADAAIVVVTIVDEPLQARNGFRGGLTMQIEPAAWGVLCTLQFSELTSVHPWSMTRMGHRSRQNTKCDKARVARR
jgi:hypothetical protein